MTSLFTAPPPPRERRQLAWKAIRRRRGTPHTWIATAFHGTYTIYPRFNPDRPWRRGDGFSVRYEPVDTAVDPHLRGFGGVDTIRDARTVIADDHAERLQALLGGPPRSAHYRSRPSRKLSATKSQLRSARAAYNALLQRSLL
jgi:hypothetical protein